MRSRKKEKIKSLFLKLVLTSKQNISFASSVLACVRVTEAVGPSLKTSATYFPVSKDTFGIEDTENILIAKKLIGVPFEKLCYFDLEIVYMDDPSKRQLNYSIASFV